MKNKIIFCIFGLLLLVFSILWSVTNTKREQISQIRKETSKVLRSKQTVEQDASDLENVYNVDDVKAKTQLIDFAKFYYTFNSQVDYNQRFEQVSDILQLSDEQKNQLFDNGLDDSGNSKIENLGLKSRYVTATAYTSETNDNLIPILATVEIETTGSVQSSVKQTIVLHAWFDKNIQKLVSIKINQVQ